MDAVQCGKQGSGASVSVTLLLAVLAAHKVLLTCAESMLAHMITKTPVLESLDAPEGPQLEEEAGGGSAAGCCCLVKIGVVNSLCCTGGLECCCR